MGYALCRDIIVVELPISNSGLTEIRITLKKQSDDQSLFSPEAKHMSFNRPIYSGMRNFLGLQDLVVSFYTKKCQFECAYCAIPTRSSEEEVGVDEIIQQIDWIWERYRDKVPILQQLSVGNEGSILDTQRFPQEVMDYFLDLLRFCPQLEVLSLETRPEYINENSLQRILTKIADTVRLDITVGWETQDDFLRQTVLNKQIPKKFFEKKLALLGKYGVRLTSYVLVKPSPTMTDEEGVEEAIATIDYLLEQRKRFGIDLVIYLNPTYIAKGSAMEKQLHEVSYQPPRIQDIYRIIQAAQAKEVPIYTGLWSEGLGDESNDFTAREDYDPSLRQYIYHLNQQKPHSLQEITV